MNLNDDVVYRCLRLRPLCQHHPGRSRGLIRYYDRFHFGHLTRSPSVCIRRVGPASLSAEFERDNVCYVATISRGCLYDYQGFVLTAEAFEGFRADNSDSASIGCECDYYVVADLDVHSRALAWLEDGCNFETTRRIVL
jgi:hypothetical protein